MALKVLSLGRRKDYILKADRESSEPTVFKLRPLTRQEHDEANEFQVLTAEQAIKIAAIYAAPREEKRELTKDECDRIEAIAPSNDPKRATAMNKRNAFIVSKGVTQIVNAIDMEGKPTEVSGSELAAVADAMTLLELSIEIQKMSELDGGQIKN